MPFTPTSRWRAGKAGERAESQDFLERTGGLASEPFPVDNLSCSKAASRATARIMRKQRPFRLAERQRRSHLRRDQSETCSVRLRRLRRGEIRLRR